MVNPDIEVVKERDMFRIRLQNALLLLLGAVAIGVVGIVSEGGMRIGTILTGSLLGAGACFWLWRCSRQYFPGVPDSLVKKLVVSTSAS